MTIAEQMNALPMLGAGLQAAESAPEAPDWWTFGTRRRREKAPQGLAEGGAPVRGALASDVGAVKGPGTGRSDDILARLSQDEHVLDAEIVALIGDGSSDAGHKKIEEMKAAIRKRKGGALANGEISPDAAPLMSYLKMEG